MATLIDLVAYLEALPTQLEPTSEDMFYAGDQQKRRIKTRTEQGIGVDGGMFRPYAARSKKDGPVTLSLTGEMMDSIVVDSDDNTAHIYFGNEEQADKARYQNDGTRRVPQRFFFGISLDDRDELISDIRESIFRRIN